MNKLFQGGVGYRAGNLLLAYRFADFSNQSLTNLTGFITETTLYNNWGDATLSVVSGVATYSVVADKYGSIAWPIPLGYDGIRLWMDVELNADATHAAQIVIDTNNAENAGVTGYYGQLRTRMEFGGRAGAMNGSLFPNTAGTYPTSISRAITERADKRYQLTIDIMPPFMTLSANAIAQRIVLRNAFFQHSRPAYLNIITYAENSANGGIYSYIHGIKIWGLSRTKDMPMNWLREQEFEASPPQPGRHEPGWSRT